MYWSKIQNGAMVQLRTVRIIFPVILQTIIIAQMLPAEGEETYTTAFE